MSLYDVGSDGLADHLADTADAHDASAVSVADAGSYLTAVNVEAALQEILAQMFTVTSYTPTLTASVSNPTLGVGGTQQGSYVRIGNLVIAWGRIQFGSSGTAAGSGNYQVALPVSANIAFGHDVGVGFIIDNSSGAAARVVNPIISDGTETVISFRYTGVTSLVTHAAPFGWAASDTIHFCVVYPAAAAV